MRFESLQDAVGSEVLDEGEFMLVFLFPSFLLVVDFTPRKARSEFVLARFEILLRHRRREDVVLDIVSEIGDLSGGARSAPAQRQVEPDSVFRLEVRIADLKREVTRMRAVVEKLLERR